MPLKHQMPGAHGKSTRLGCPASPPSSPVAPVPPVALVSPVAPVALAVPVPPTNGWEGLSRLQRTLDAGRMGLSVGLLLGLLPTLLGLPAMIRDLVW